MHLHTDDVNQAFFTVMRQVKTHGVKEDSRNGPVLAFDEPFALTYNHPRNRVLFCSARKDDPFLNFFDALLTWSNDINVEYMALFSPRFKEFANDGLLLGHYGNRVNGVMPAVLNKLRDNPNTRRVVIPIYDSSDIMAGDDIKDVPCNVMLIPRISHASGALPTLDLTVINRSNDVAWGLLGANALQFATLHEVMANSLLVDQGQLTHFTTNLHGYTEFGPFARFYKSEHPINEGWDAKNLDRIGNIRAMNMNWMAFQKELDNLLLLLDDFMNSEFENPISAHTAQDLFVTRYFQEVVVPVFNLWLIKKLNPKEEELPLHVKQIYVKQIQCPMWQKRFEILMTEGW